MKLRVVFYAEPGHKFDDALAPLFGNGVRVAGDRFRAESALAFTPDRVGAATDVAVFVGVKGRSRVIFDAYRAAGKHTLVIDKGHVRLPGPLLRSLYWRTSMDDLQPHAYLFRQPHPPDRWEAMGIEIVPAGIHPGQVLFCGGSQKYCTWHALGDANAHALAVLNGVAAYTTAPLTYRPKPSFNGATPLPGYGFSPGAVNFKKVLRDTAQVVTFGSNAAFEALLLGVPVVVLGDAIARSLAGTRLCDVAAPRLPDPGAVYGLACAVAYCQWTADELRDGTAWRHLREVLALLEK